MSTQCRTVCDRCGKEIKSWTDGGYLSVRMEVMPFAGAEINAKFRNTDLCISCGSSFAEWCTANGT